MIKEGAHWIFIWKCVICSGLQTNEREREKRDMDRVSS